MREEEEFVPRSTGKRACANGKSDCERCRRRPTALRLYTPPRKPSMSSRYPETRKMNVPTTIEMPVGARKDDVELSSNEELEYPPSVASSDEARFETALASIKEEDPRDELFSDDEASSLPELVPIEEETEFVPRMHGVACALPWHPPRHHRRKPMGRRESALFRTNGRPLHQLAEHAAKKMPLPVAPSCRSLPPRLQRHRTPRPLKAPSPPRDAPDPAYPARFGQGNHVARTATARFLHESSTNARRNLCYGRRHQGQTQTNESDTTDELEHEEDKENQEEKKGKGRMITARIQLPWDNDDPDSESIDAAEFMASHRANHRPCLARVPLPIQDPVNDNPSGIHPWKAYLEEEHLRSRAWEDDWALQPFQQTQENPRGNASVNMWTILHVHPPPLTYEPLAQLFPRRKQRHPRFFTNNPTSLDLACRRRETRHTPPPIVHRSKRFQAFKAAYLANIEIIDDLMAARAALKEGFSRVEDIIIRHHFDLDTAVPVERQRERHPLLYDDEAENLRFAQRVLRQAGRDALAKCIGELLFLKPDFWTKVTIPSDDEWDAEMWDVEQDEEDEGMAVDVFDPPATIKTNTRAYLRYHL
ncbi:hypothetical protein C8J57DRAFT_1215794 [Mycena rebaudengoi]|nr:hypothetical protein C8J57DRAFT_1215794 [Mycena rebaudengoi]